MFVQKGAEPGRHGAGWEARELFPVVICVDNKPLAGFRNKKEAISPGTYSLCRSKGTFLHLLWVPQVLPAAHSSQGCVLLSGR